jgi:hypothetical protein
MNSLMRKSLAITMLGCVFWVACFMSGSSSNPFWIILFGFCGIGLLLTCLWAAFVGAISWRKSSHCWMMPAILCVVFLISVRAVARFGLAVEDWRFGKQLIEYSEAVDEIRKDAIVSKASLNDVVIKNTPRGVISIRALRCDNGEVVVFFLTGAGGRLHHGYVFDGCNCLAKPPVEVVRFIRKLDLRPITGGWYGFSD